MSRALQIASPIASQVASESPPVAFPLLCNRLPNAFQSPPILLAIATSSFDPLRPVLSAELRELLRRPYNLRSLSFEEQVTSYAFECHRLPCMPSTAMGCRRLPSKATGCHWMLLMPIAMAAEQAFTSPKSL